MNSATRFLSRFACLPLWGALLATTASCALRDTSREASVHREPEFRVRTVEQAFLNGLNILSLRVPEDIGLVGFSNELFSRLMVPMLTSIDQHCELMGRAATRLLLQIMEEQSQQAAPQHIVLQPDLFVRASSLRTAPPK